MVFFKIIDSQFLNHTKKTPHYAEFLSLIDLLKRIKHFHAQSHGNQYLYDIEHHQR